MDRMYRRQRHIYDASRKFYLLGRDAMIADLRPPAGGSVLEIACGTGRNLVRLARTYPDIRCFGLDVSTEMLETAGRAVTRAGLRGRIRLAQGDATAFDPEALFGRNAFDRIVISYALSMIPPWRAALGEAAHRLAPGGALHVVDFGDQHGLPDAARRVLNRWLGAFHVTPRGDLPAILADMGRHPPWHATVRQKFGGYAVHGVIARDARTI